MVSKLFNTGFEEILYHALHLDEKNQYYLLTFKNKIVIKKYTQKLLIFIWTNCSVFKLVKLAKSIEHIKNSVSYGWTIDILNVKTAVFVRRLSSMCMRQKSKVIPQFWAWANKEQHAWEGKD